MGSNSLTAKESTGARPPWQSLVRGTQRSGIWIVPAHHPQKIDLLFTLVWQLISGAKLIHTPALLFLYSKTLILYFVT